MAKTIPNKIFDSIVKDQVALDRYAAGLNSNVQAVLQNTQSEIVAMIAKYDPTEPNMTKWKLDRLEKLNKEIGSILDVQYGKIGGMVDEGLKKTASVSAKRMVESYNNIVGADLFQVTLTPTNVKSIVENTMIDGRVIGEWWDKQAASAKERMAATMAAGTKAIQIGLVQGESIGDLIGRIRGTATTPGIMSLTKKEAAALVRTSVMSVANAARIGVYKANSDVLDGVEVVATLDARTTPMCQALDGKQFDMDGNPIGHDMKLPAGPPFHWQCRSTLAPVTKSWAELAGPKSQLTKKQIRSLDNIPIGERSSLNGPMSARLNYNDWLLLQPEAFQKEVLGPGKWRLWSENKLAVSDLVDNSARPLTIAELQDRFGLKYSGDEGPDIMTRFDKTEASEWVDASTLAEAKAIFRKKFNIVHVEAPGSLTIDAVNAVGRGLTSVKTLEFLTDVRSLPGLKILNLDDVEYLISTSAGKKATGIYSSRERKIRIASGKGRSVGDGLDMGKWHVGGDISSTVRHEYGHHLQDASISKKARNEWGGIYWSHNKDWWKASVSHYSSQDVFESFAESFSVYSSPLYGTKSKYLLPKELEDYFVKTFGKNKFLREGADAAGSAEKMAALTRESAEKAAALAAEKEARMAAERLAVLERTLKDPKKVATFAPGDVLPPGAYEPVKDVKILPRVELPEPKFVSSAKRPGAGIIMVEDDGRVWIVAPKDKYGGVEYTFAKGGPEGLTVTAAELQKTAIREIFEETGLQGEIFGYLGDYERKTSLVRYYLGRRIAGSPVMMGAESERVLLVPMSELRGFLKASADLKIVDDLEAMYKKAMALGEGNFAKGIAAINRDLTIFKSKFDDFVSEFSDTKMIDFPAEMTYEQKLAFAQVRLDGKISSKMESWAMEEGTSGRAAYDKFGELSKTDLRGSYKKMTEYAAILEERSAAALAPGSKFMGFAEKKALEELKASDLVHDGDPAFLTYGKVKAAAAKATADAEKELALIRAGGYEAIEKEAYEAIEKNRLAEAVPKPPLPAAEMLFEVKEVAKALARDAKFEIDSWAARVGAVDALAIRNEIALLDPTFSSSNLVRQARLIKEFSSPIEKILKETKSILEMVSPKASAEYTLRVSETKDLTLEMKLRLLKEIVKEEDLLAKAYAKVDGAGARYLKDMTDSEKSMVSGTLKSMLAKGKAPAEGSKLRSLWESLASTEKTRMLELWVRKGVSVPDTFLSEYLGGASRAAKEALEKSAFELAAKKLAESELAAKGLIAREEARKTGRYLKDMTDSEKSMVSGTLRPMLAKGKVPAEGSRLKALWESLAPIERERMLKIWTAKGVPVPPSFLEKYLSGYGPAPREVGPVLSKDLKLRLSDYQQYAPQKGSNPGGFYSSKENPADRWYFKFPDDPKKVHNEILSARLYQACGVEVPDVIIVEGPGGKLGVASRVMDGVEMAPSTLTTGSIRAGIQENFVVDAWLGNWDVVGQGYNNLLIKDGVRGIRIDMGGSLLYRAKGGMKGSAFGAKVGELESMTSGTLNPEAISVFSFTTQEELRIGAAKVLRIKDSEIRKIVDEFGPGSAFEKKQLADILIERKKFIERRFAEIDVDAKVPESVVLSEIQVKALDVAKNAGRIDDEEIRKLNSFAHSSVVVTKEMVEKLSKKIEKEMTVCQSVPITDKKIYDSLMKNPVMKNQFVLGRHGSSQGSHIPYKDGGRDNWENTFSKGILQKNPVYKKMKDGEYFITAEQIEAAYERPIYGFVLDGANIGAARSYGRLMIVYNPEVRYRASFCLGNSSSLGSNLNGFGSVKGPLPLVEALIRNTMRDGGKDLRAFLSGEKTLNQVGFHKREYIESQIYGKTHLKRDAQYFVWNDDGAIPHDVQLFADRMGKKLYSLDQFNEMINFGKAL